MFELPLLPRTLSAAERDLASSKERIRLDAVRDLGRWTPDPLERGSRIELLARASRDDSPVVRKEALLALADQADERVLPVVRPVLRATDVEMRELAVLVLGECATPGDEGAIADVRPLLRAAEPRLRFQALTALTRLAPDEREQALVDALADRDAEVRVLALELVDEAWRRPRTPAAVVAAVAGLPLDSDPRARLLRELIGAERGQPWSTSAILRAVEGAERFPDGALVARAIEAAGRLRLAEATPALRRRAFGWFASETFRASARAALAALGDERAVAAIRKELRHRSRVRVGGAVLSLARADARQFRADVERAYEDFATTPELREELDEFLGATENVADGRRP